jgi:hypothetical protein
MPIINLLQHFTLKCYCGQIIKSVLCHCRRKYDFKNFSFEKLRSADATVTRMVNRILYAILALGKQSCRFRDFRILLITEHLDRSILYYILVITDQHIHID